MKIGIVGAGNVGTAVGLLLKKKGNEIMGICSRTRESALKAAYRLGCNVSDMLTLSQEAEVLFLTTKDSAIEEVCQEILLAGGFFPGQTVVHMSGSLTTEALQPAHTRGCHLLSIHPLQSCASVDLAVENIPGSIFSIEGDKQAYELGEQIVTELEGQFFYIDKETKPLYHAAACAASNYLVALLDLSRQLMLAAGMPHELATGAILPLVHGTLKNIVKLGTVDALTGPIARGDLSTLEEHLAVMQENIPELLQPYTSLGLYTAGLAEMKGTLSQREKQQFNRLFNSMIDINDDDNNEEEKFQKLQ